MLDRSAEMIVAFMAVLKAARPFLPLDSSYPSERISFMLEHRQNKGRDTYAGTILTPDLGCLGSS